ncbi:MAG: hypothetical protein R2827_15145 [Bdellovibrionales bacterium]
MRFFTGEESTEFRESFEINDFLLDPKDEMSLKSFQSRIERQRGPFYLDASEIRNKPLDDPFSVFTKIKENHV